MSPLTVTLGGDVWTVLFIPSTDPVLAEMDALGLCVYNELRIYVASDISPKQRSEILLHELIHAISYHFNRDITEKQVTILARGLLMLHVQNGGLMENIFSESLWTKPSNA